MSQVTIRANLSSAHIPLLSEEFGRSIIVRAQDINYTPQLNAKGTDVDKDVGIPQVYYAHNVLPTHYGYRSISFSAQIPGIGIVTFSQVFNLLGSAGQKAFLAVCTDGSLYICHSGTGYTWVATTGYYKAINTTGVSNVGDGQMVSAKVYTGAGADVYTAVMSSATAFAVSKNGTAEGAGTTGTEYTSVNGKVKFTINTATIPFSAGDTFTLTLSLATFTGNITKSALSGETYIASEGSGIFQYDFTANVFIWRLAAGVLTSEILGITASNGYMILYSKDTVLWSSLIDQLDFIPSLSTGAGGGSIEEADGPVRRVVGLSSGFLVFTAANCVGASFSNNSRYPFVYRAVSNAGGIPDLSQVTDEADGTSVYAFTTHGLQQISIQKAVGIMPEISDMLTGKRFEDFDSGTLSFSTQNLTVPLKKRIEFISGRYLIISYGMTSFTHAVVVDTTLNRSGKIKLPHVSAFQYGFLDADDADTPKKQIAFLASNGLVKTVEFAAGVTSDDSVCIIGRFQYVRQRTLQLDSVELESVDPNTDCQLYTYPAEDSKSLTNPILGAQKESGMTRTYRFRATAKTHTLCLKGTFRLNSLVISFNVHGVR